MKYLDLNIFMYDATVMSAPRLIALHIEIENEKILRIKDLEKELGKEPLYAAYIDTMNSVRPDKDAVQCYIYPDPPSWRNGAPPKTMGRYAWPDETLKYLDTLVFLRKSYGHKPEPAAKRASVHKPDNKVDDVLYLVGERLEPAVCRWLLARSGDFRTEQVERLENNVIQCAQDVVEGYVEYAMDQERTSYSRRHVVEHHAPFKAKQKGVDK